MSTPDLAPNPPFGARYKTAVWYQVQISHFVPGTFWSIGAWHERGWGVLGFVRDVLCGGGCVAGEDHVAGEETYR